MCLKPHPTVPPPAHPFSLYDQLVKDPGNPETGIATAEAENFRFGRQRRTAQSSWGGDLSFCPGGTLERRSVVRRSCSLSSRPNRLCQAIRRNFFQYPHPNRRSGCKTYIGLDLPSVNSWPALLKLPRLPPVEYSTYIRDPLGLVQLLTGPFRVGGALYGRLEWLSR